MHILDLGLVDYSEALRIQKEAAENVAQGGEERLFLLEHRPVITFGRNGGEENLPFPRSFFQSRGVDTVQTDRGGNITCHFPGQLVAYPIMRIGRYPGGLRRFFHAMEESVIRTLLAFGLSPERIPGRAGVWIRGRKICSTGIAVKRWVSCHGLSLNVAKDISLFELVSPCGLAGVSATSIQRELADTSVSMPQVKQAFARSFREVFDREHWTGNPGVSAV